MILAAVGLLDTVEFVPAVGDPILAMIVGYPIPEQVEGKLLQYELSILSPLKGYYTIDPIYPHRKSL